MSRRDVDPPLELAVPQRLADMRRLLVEVAEYARAMPRSATSAKPAIWMAVIVREVVPELLGAAFGPRIMAT